MPRQAPRALMIMPFDPQFDDVYAQCQKAVEATRVKAAVQQDHPRSELLCALELYRVDEGHGAAPIMDDLLGHMKDADLVIADISGNNPNVLWELGYAMALGKPVIILSQELSKAPFDVSSYRKLPYERNQLVETLFEKLTGEIMGLFSQVPEVASSPDESGFARILAMSTSAPAYFLDAEYNILYMNEAVIALFLADGVGSADEWIGQPLGSFISAFADRLLNLPEIEQNLQIQKANLRQAGLTRIARPLNIEKIVLDTKHYGVVEMQKTGIAVRNPSDGSITGWVVSFNVVSSRNPDAFAKFHEKHKSILEGRILCLSDASIAPLDTSTAEDTGLEWKSPEEGAFELVWASGYEEKQVCFEFICRAMMEDQDRYGLESIDKLPLFFFDYKNTEYLRLEVSSEIVGVLRLHLHHNMSQYQNLVDDVILAIQDNQGFADAGIYFPRQTPTDQRLKFLGKLLGAAVSRLEDHAITNLYAQVPKKLVKRYKEFGFSEAGKEFLVAGWKGRWCPIWVDNWNFGSTESAIGKEFQREFMTTFQAGRSGGV